MTIEQAAEILRNRTGHSTLAVTKASMVLSNAWLDANPTIGHVALPRDDDDELFNFPWVAANFRSAGPQYSMRIHDDVPGFCYINRSGYFEYENLKIHDMETRGDVRRFVASIGVPLALDKLPSDWNRKSEWLEISEENQ